MKRSKSSRILKILSYVLLITGMIVILYPFYLTIITALKTPQESSQSFFSFPQSFYLGNFVNVLQKANYFVFFRNSAVVTLVSVFLIMVLIPMCSYAIARNMEKRYYKTMYFYLLAGIFVPFQVIMVPLVKYLAKLKLCNIPGLIIMCVTLASSQGVFLLVNYIRSVPRDLEEAAYIDGCGTVKAYVKIVLPMIKPILATIFVLNALWVWNDFQMPLLILNQSQDMWTLPLFQYNFKSQYSFDYNLAFASYLIDETMAALEEMKRKGYIRYVGVSNFTAEQIKEAEQYIQIDVQQPLYSMVDRGFEDLMSWGYDRGIDSMTYGSMGAGILSGKIRSVPSFEKNDLRLNFYDVYKEPKFSKIMELLKVMDSIADGHNVPVGQVALNWSTQKEYVGTALVGVRSIEHADENCKTFDWKLTEEEMKILDSKIEECAL